MRFRCERDTLAEALANAGRAVSTSAPRQVLVGVRMDLQDQTLRITGSNLDLTINSSVLVNGEADGTVVVNAKLVADIVRALGEGAVELSAPDEDEGDLVITSGRSEFSVRLMPTTEFPRLADPVGDDVTVDAEAFASAVRQVVTAASNEETRPTLRGVLVEAEGDGVKLVATDSYRLAVRDLPGTSLLTEGQRVLVPRTALQELLRMLGSAEELTFRPGEQMVTFEVGEANLVARLIEGDFPPYRHLIPENHPNRIVVDRDELIEAVKRVKVMARDTSTPIRLALHDGEIELTADTPEYGSGVAHVDAECTASDLVVAFNPEYLIDGAEAAEGDRIMIEMIDDRQPALLRSTESDEFRYVLMPVRI